MLLSLFCFLGRFFGIKGGDEVVVYRAKIHGQKEINSGNTTQRWMPGPEEFIVEAGSATSLVLADVGTSYQQTLLLCVLPKPALD